MKSLEGKVALVTGGSTGIGFAAAQRFAHEGASVVIANTNAEKGEAAAQKIRDAGGEVTFIQTDVSKVEEVKHLVEQTVSTYGRLDYAFNNAGVPAMGPISGTDEATWDRTVDVNLKGVYFSMKYETQQMLKNGGGAIVNTSSTAGGKGMAGMSAYVASKFGVNGLTKALALEYADANIRINAVMPGPIETPMMDGVRQVTPGIDEQFVSLVPAKRIGQPGEVAEAVLWLCSDAASYVTGTNIPVDGGMLEL